jgi:PAS domain S-box-containing protein
MPAMPVADVSGPFDLGDLADVSPEVLQHLVDRAPTGIVLTSRDGRYLYASPGAAAVMGQAPMPIPGATKHDVFNPVAAARLAAMEQRLAERGGRERDVISVSSPRGERTFLVDKFLVGGDDEVVCTFVQDLTDLHRLEQELLASRQRLLSVLDDAKVAALRVDADGCITDLWNGSIDFDMGSAETDAIGRPISEYLGDSPEIHALLARALAGEALVEVIEFFGRWLEIHVSPEGEPSAPGAINAVAIDVTDRIAAEQALGRTQDVLERLQSQSPVGMVAVHHAVPNRPYYVSPNMKRLLGYTPGDIPFTIEWALTRTHPDDVEAVAEFLGAITEDRGSTHTLDFRFRNADGDYRWIQVRSESLFDDAGVPVGIVAFHTDITDAVTAEQARRRLEAQLRRSERLESLGQLAGGIAHDFNNLLVVIANYAQFVDASVRREADRGAPFDGAAVAEILDDLRQISRATETAAELTRQLLVFGRRDLGSHTTFDLGEVVGEMQDMLARSLGGAITPSFVLSADPLPVRADPGQIQQLLLNLVMNARHAMPEGGRLEVVTRRTVIDEHRPDSVLAPGPCAELTVSDTGHGMSDAVRERAFEPFYTTKGPGDGTGLGLAIVYAVATECGGDVDLMSAPGAGTSIRVRLPITSILPTPSPTTGGPADARAGEVVMVVEDQPAVRELTRRVLDKHGYAVLDAQDGHAALALLADPDTRCDLLLTDVMMPGMLGNELARRVRTLRPGTKVLYMTGYADASVIDSVADDPESGGVVTKPFTSGQLLGRVREILDA